MLKARIGPTVLLGLDARNVELLKQGKPIMVKGEDIGIEGGLRIALMYGETIDDIVRELERTGVEIPRDALGNLVGDRRNKA